MKQTISLKKRMRDVPMPSQTIDDDVIVIEETSSPQVDLIASGNSVTFQQYLSLYTDFIKLKDEHLRLKSKLITTQEDLRKWKENKTSPKTKLQGEDLKNAIIDIILSSGLNIESIPDDLEREIYSVIINQISTSTSMIKRIFFCG